MSRQRPGEISTAEWRRRAELQFSPLLPVALWLEIGKELMRMFSAPRSHQESTDD